MTEPIKVNRSYEKAVEAIKDSIAKGQLLPGDSLPPERQMIKEMGISRSSLREAFHVLELLGLIESLPGKGRFVREPHAQHRLNSGEQMLCLANSAILDLMEARRVLDPAMGAEAARKATAADMLRLQRIITSTESNLEDISHRARSDYNFHLAVAEATHNFLFVHIVRMEFNLIMATHREIYTHLRDKAAFCNEHTLIYKAIQERDASQASEASLQHINRIYTTLHRVFCTLGNPTPTHHKNNPTT